jgi:hypothetical protein
VAIDELRPERWNEPAQIRSSLAQVHVDPNAVRLVVAEVNNRHVRDLREQLGDGRRIPAGDVGEQPARRYGQIAPGTEFSTSSTARSSSSS